MKPKLPLLSVAIALAGCAATAPMSGRGDLPSPQVLDAQTREVMRASFRDQGIAKVDRLTQDAAQQACSTDQPPSAETAIAIQDAALARVRWPSDGRFLGDWKEGEKLAQNGRGMTWTDTGTDPAGNGGSCYNCHQISKAELSYGTLGPSLYRYGATRGVVDPADPKSAAVIRSTWAKLWNSKSAVACSNMPRFGDAGLLNEDQLRHLMALLLDPRSPVNQ